ncbi:MAG: hypothetical protein JXQ65_15620 [Candidatus Marinimicrobia bacterium]|nr:hypothetical protein [Candidatus Neomarinimicrobiota bacterium]
MKKLTALTFFLTAFVIVLMVQPTDLNAQGHGQGRGFSDENGDGFNDLAIDTDGDGIPDMHDPDSPNFVDENGDGYNDNAPDTDGDGVPNYYDEDYVRSPRDGSGRKMGFAGRKGQRGGFTDENADGFNDNAIDSDGDGIPDFHDTDSPNFIDENGDGYNDNARDSDGDGIPNVFDEDFVKGAGMGEGRKGGFNRNADGTKGAGTCDGTGLSRAGRGNRGRTK